MAFKLGEQSLFKTAQIHSLQILAVCISNHGYNTEGKITTFTEPVPANVLYTNHTALGYFCYTHI